MIAPKKPGNWVDARGLLVIGEFGVFSPTTGTINFSSGSADYTISNTGAPILYGGLSDNAELSFVYDGGSNWDLDAVFSISNVTIPDFQMILYSYVDADSQPFTETFNSRFQNYTISWVGGSGTATIVDPAGQIAGGKHRLSPSYRDPV